MSELSGRTRARLTTLAASTALILVGVLAGVALTLAIVAVNR